MKQYAGVIVRANNKCLMCKRSPKQTFLPNVWSIPSGYKEDGETPIEAAVREFYEETALTPNMLVPVSVMYNNDNSKVHLFLMDSIKEIKPDLERAIDGHEHTECAYFSKEELPETTENLKKVLEILL
jgi:ADP-ribose pyrophosphatase YjhB (NUDIX family)